MHVEEGAARVALRAIPNLYCITDAVAATGMAPGEYRLGRQRRLKQEDAVGLADGTLAGSVLTMDQALRNLHALGLPLARGGAALRDPSGRLSRARGARPPRVGRRRRHRGARPRGRLEAVFVEGQAIAAAAA